MISEITIMCTTLNPMKQEPSSSNFHPKMKCKLSDSDYSGWYSEMQLNISESLITSLPEETFNDNYLENAQRKIYRKNVFIYFLFK